MNRTTSKRLRYITLILAIPGVAIAVVVAFALWFNPMLLAFLVSFSVQNSTNEDLRVLPIGMIEGSGLYGPLPRYQNSSPPARSIDRQALTNVPAQSASQITYDYDDINFRLMLIVDQNDRVYMLYTDNKGDLRNCYGPQKATYRIPPLETLRPAPPELLPCLEGKHVKFVEQRE